MTGHDEIPTTHLVPTIGEAGDWQFDELPNPFIGGANVPDAGGYNVFAVMNDGGSLCYRCVIDPTNPVRDDRNHGDRVVWHGDGWGVIAFEADGNVDGPEYCDHCNAVIVPDYNEED